MSKSHFRRKKSVNRVKSGTIWGFLQEVFVQAHRFWSKDIERVLSSYNRGLDNRDFTVPNRYLQLFS